MSSQRPIKDEMWSDSWFYELDPSEKLLWVFLLTNERQNVAGIYQANMSWICSNTGFDKQVVEMILRRFEESGKIARKNDWIVLLNHYKHQSLSPKIEEGMARILNELPDDILDIYPIHRVCLRYRTLLNLTKLIIGENNSPVAVNMWNKRYADDFEEGVVDLDGDGKVIDPQAETKAKDKQDKDNIKHNLRLVEEPRGLAYTPAALNADVKVYQQLLKYGWSHDGIIGEYLVTIEDPYWKEEKLKGKYPTLKTVEFRLRNKKPV